MASKVAKIGVKRASGFLYFLDKKGDVSRVAMARGGGRPTRSRPEKVANAGVTREAGVLYVIEQDGDVSRAKSARPCCAGRGCPRCPQS